MPTTANMSLVLPTDHGSADLWGALLNTVFGLIDSHSHVTGQGVPIPSSALKIDADVSWSFGGTSRALKDALAIDLLPSAAASVASYSSALFSNSSDANNLYYRNSSGVNVKITDGSTLNVSIVGGIGGDYTSVGALLSYDDASRNYLLQQQGSPRPWAGLSTADIGLYEKAASITNKVTLKSPAALAASYSLTMLAALPASTRMLQVSSGGVLTAGDNYTTTGTITAGDVAWTVARGFIVPGVMAQPQGTHAYIATAAGGISGINMASDAAKIVYPVSGLTINDQVTGYTLFLNKSTANTTTLSARLYKYDGTSGVETALGAGVSNSATNPGFITLSETFGAILVAGFQFYLLVNNGAGTAGDILYNLEVDFTRA